MLLPNIQNYYPLSHQQLRIWWAEQVAADHCLNVPLRFDIEGNLDTKILSDSIKEIVENYAILNAKFFTKDKSIVQEFSRNNFAMEMLDFQALDDNAIEDNISQIVSVRYNLIEGSPLVKILLIKKDTHSFVLLILTHHIILDGIACVNLVSMINEVYNKKLLSVEYTLVPPLYDYNQYVVDNNKNDDAVSVHREFWINHLRNVSVSNIFSTNNFGSNIYPIKEFVNLELSEQDFIQIQRLSSNSRVTPFIFFLSIYLLLLHKITSEEKILIATPISKRDSEDLQQLIGLIADIVPYSFSINRVLSFKEFLINIKEQFFTLLEHSEQPIENIFNQLKANNTLELSDYYKLMIVFNDYSNLSLKLEGTSSTFIDTFCGARADLLLAVTTKDKKVSIRFEYEPEYFCHEYIENFARLYSALITQVLNNEDAVLKDYSIIVPEEEHILHQFEHGPQTHFDTTKSIIDLFDELVASYPEKIALITRERNYTFGELKQKVDNIAQYLEGLFVQPGDVVAVMLERSVDVYTALLGILRVGGIYMPIPDIPLQRITYMLEQARPKLVLSKNGVRNFNDIQGYEVVDIIAIYSNPKANISLKRKFTTFTEQCYILFTSGSTGKPKAVLGSQYGLLNRLYWAWRQFPFTTEDICCHITSIGFIDSLTEMLTPLLRGVPQVIIADIITNNADEFINNLVLYNITRFTTVPSLLRFFSDTFAHYSEKLKCLRLIISSGEEIDYPLAIKYSKILPHVKIANFYGSTEVNGDATFYEINNAELQGNKYISIGKPIDNASIYILNKYNERMPLLFTGEIAIGDMPVNNGYLNEALDNKFILNPFKKGVIYKTGDYGYYLRDGNIRYIGRESGLIKIFGHRVSIKEIKRAILDIPEIIDVYIQLTTDNNFALLTAYLQVNIKTFFAIHGNKDAACLRIRNTLSAVLPFYMIPSEYVFLNSFPKLYNGKLDIRALTLNNNRNTHKQIHSSDDFNIKEKIIHIWKKVLGIKKIDLDINFFDLGGDSLRLVQVHKELINSLPTIIAEKLTVIDLFTYHSINKLSEYCYFLNCKPNNIESKLNNLVNEDRTSNDIAIIGFSCEFPGAKNAEEFWANLKSGTESIKFLDTHHGHREISSKILATAQLDCTEYFDHEFFGYTEAEAKLMDPQHRVLLQECHKALENAGYSPELYEGKIGIFVGAGDSRYFINNILSNNRLRSTSSFDVDFWTASQLNSTQFLSTKIAYKLNCTGPALNITTACSTSLVAIAMAVEYLRSGKCDIILAGGVSLVLPDDELFEHQKGSILSRDGHCRPFSADADGTLIGSGVGVVVLKKLQVAMKDNDTVYAVIKGASINNDGSKKVSFSAPSVIGQEQCIIEALSDAGVAPETITYIESHGTGTKLGDPIEFAALTKAFNLHNAQSHCAIGSVKANIGHANIAAGVASFIKVVMCLYYKQLVPLINFNAINPDIDIQNSPFYINTSLIKWNRDDKAVPLRASVNSLGIGGTNAHVILEEWPATHDKNTVDTKQDNILCFSAKSKEVLKEIIEQFLAFLLKQTIHDTQYAIADIAFTLAKGRQSFEYRTGFVCRDIKDAIVNLKKFDVDKILYASNSIDCVFILSDHKVPDWVSERLYNEQKLYRDILDDCKVVIESRLHDTNSNHLSKEELLSLSRKYSLLKFLMLIGLRPKYTLYDSQSQMLIKCIYQDMQFNIFLDYKADDDYYDNCIQFQHDNLSHIIDSLNVQNNREQLIFLDIFSLLDSIDLDGALLKIFDRGHKKDLLLYKTTLYLWSIGVPISLDVLSLSNHRVALPTYPFQKIKHWIRKEPDNNIKPTENINIGHDIGAQVLNIWQEVFENNNITITDEFYSLGGHSLIALQIISRIAEHFSVDVDISLILQGINVKDLCEIIAQGNKNQIITQDIANNETHTYPLSSAEHRMWLLDIMYAKSGICNIPIAIKLTGTINVATLDEAIACLIQKHAMLRAYLRLDGEHVLHHISQEIRVSAEIINCTSENELQANLAQLIQTEFDLTRGPLFRVVLINEPLNIQTIFFIFHHIIMDAWSVKVFLEDLNSFYVALSKGETIPTVSLSTSYYDFVKYQRDLMQGDALHAQKIYWLNKLANFNYTPNIFYNISAHKNRRYDAKNYLITLDDVTTSSVLSFARQNGLTLFVVLISIYKLLISLYTGSQDVTVVAPFANRKQKNLEGVIGLFTNFIMLRSNLSKANNFYELTRIVRDIILEAHNNSDLPFEEVLQDNNIDISSLFIFIMHETTTQNSELFGCVIEEKFNLYPPTSQSLMSLEVKVKSSNLVLNFVYSECVIEPQLAQKFANQYVDTLTQLVQFPVNNLSEYFLPKESDLQCFDNDLDYPLDRDLYSLFYEVLNKNFNEVVVIEYGGKTYSYLYLAQTIDTIIHSLTDLGIKEGMVIGVCVEHSINLIACILAILRLGCIYLPLDPTYPHKRLQYYIDDSGTNCILTTRVNEVAQSFKVKNLIYIDQLNPISSTQLQSIAPIKVSNKIASIVYTSGSTGTPKGVMIKHSGIINRCYWFARGTDVSNKEVFCLSTSINFVDSLAEIFSPLLLGYKLYIPTKQSILKIDTFLAALKEHEVTHLVVVPSLLNLILENANAKLYLRNLSRIICSGDVLSRDTAKKCLDLGLALKLYNYYGSTEVTADATFYEVTMASLQLNQLIPIGQEISNTKVLILNNRREIVPNGILGLIYVTGCCLAEGYWEERQQTTEKFISIEHNGKNYTLFNTGDIGYRSEDGVIFYLGRQDSVVNINGHKINLLEIETILKNNARVQNAIVQNIINGDSNMIVAFIVLVPNISNASHQNIRLELIHHLSQFLPQYMMPNVYKFIENIPLTTNGKIDRNKLKDGYYIDVELDNNEVFVPQNECQQFVYEQFLELLNIKAAKLSDNFLYIGGTSLLLIKFTSILERKFNVNINIANIFNDATLNNIINIVQSSKPDSTIPDFIFKISEDDFCSQTLILFPPISGLSYSYIPLKKWLTGYNIYCVNYPYLETDNTYFNSIASIAEYYIAKMMSILEQGQKITLIGYSFGGIVAAEAVKYLRANNIQVEQLIIIDSYYPTHIAKDKTVIEQEIEKSIANINFDSVGLKKSQIVERMYKNYDLLAQHNISRLSVPVYLLKTLLYPQKHIEFWRQYVSEDLSTIDIKGDHYSVIDELNIEIIGKKIREILS